MKKIYKSRKNKIIAGVCGGIAARLKIDPSFIRFCMIFIGTLTGFVPIIVIYIIASLIIPEEPRGYTYPKFRMLYRSVHNKKLAGICGGLGEFFKVDPTLMRLLVVVLGFITGIVPMVLSYIIGCFIIPEHPAKDGIIEID